MFQVEDITFEEILPYWRDQLWVGRTSPIETHSVMLPPRSEDSPMDFDMSVFDLPVWFHAVKHEGKIIGVNSCHWTDTDWTVRSRGLWVQEEYRRTGIARLLLEKTISISKESNRRHLFVWSIPRISALPAYQAVGFRQFGSPFNEGMEFGPNVVVMLQLRR